MTNATASAPLQLKGFGKPGSRPDILVVSVICVLGLLWAISAAAFSHDLGMSVLAYIFAGAFALGIFAISFAGSKGLLANDDSKYMDGVLKAGVFASTFWGVVGMLVGVIIASQLAFPEFLYFKDFGFLNFGRLRPIHTSGVIFAFGGNILILTAFYLSLIHI